MWKFFEGSTRFAAATPHLEGLGTTQSEVLRLVGRAQATMDGRPTTSPLPAGSHSLHALRPGAGIGWPPVRELQLRKTGPAAMLGAAVTSPAAPTEILDWWLLVRKDHNPLKQKGVDLMVMLVLWCLWKERKISIN